MKKDTPYISGIIEALVMSNPFANLVIGNIGHIYSDIETHESFQTVTRSISEKCKCEEASQKEVDNAWKKDDFQFYRRFSALVISYVNRKMIHA